MASGPVQVTAGVIRRGAHVLICQRAPGSWHAGKWEFPGGKVEPGETLAEGLRRELREELAIEAVVGVPLWRTAYQYAGREPFVLTFFAVSSFTGSLTNREFSAVEWVPVAALPNIDFLEGDLEFVRALASGRV